jgi:hypothetical protein
MNEIHEIPSEIWVEKVDSSVGGAKIQVNRDLVMTENIKFLDENSIHRESLISSNICNVQSRECMQFIKSALSVWMLL